MGAQDHNRCCWLTHHAGGSADLSCGAGEHVVRDAQALVVPCSAEQKRGAGSYRSCSRPPPRRWRQGAPGLRVQRQRGKALRRVRRVRQASPLAAPRPHPAAACCLSHACTRARRGRGKVTRRGASLRAQARDGAGLVVCFRTPSRPPPCAIATTPRRAAWMSSPWSGRTTRGSGCWPRRSGCSRA